MSNISIAGDTSGTVTLQAPAVAGSTTLTLPATSGTVVIGTTPSGTIVGTTDTQTLTNKTLTSPTITGASMSSMASSVLTSGTAQNSTSGTSITFTGIPSWAKRITVMFQGVSISGTSGFYMQVGSGSTTTTGYVGCMIPIQTISVSGTGVADSTGFVLVQPFNAATDTNSGTVTLTNITGNTWVESGMLSTNTNIRVFTSNGYVPLSGALDRVVITTTNGTDTFDAGSINIMFE